MRSLSHYQGVLFFSASTIEQAAFHSLGSRSSLLKSPCSRVEQGADGPPILERADANKDNKLTLDELTSAATLLFDEIDKAKASNLDESAIGELPNAPFPAPNFGPPPSNKPGDPKIKDKTLKSNRQRDFRPSCTKFGVQSPFGGDNMQILNPLTPSLSRQSRSKGAERNCARSFSTLNATNSILSVLFQADMSMMIASPDSPAFASRRLSEDHL